MAPRRRNEMSAVHLVIGFAILLAVVVGARLGVVWLASSSGPVRLIVSFTIVVVFVGIPAAYGLRGLLREESAPEDDELP